MDNLIGGRVRRAIGLISALLLLLSYPNTALAGVKLTLSDITKWEVISSNKVVGYAGETPLVFVSLVFCPSLSIGGAFVLRAFSPSITADDTVIVNGKQCLIFFVESIRQD